MRVLVVIHLSSDFFKRSTFCFGEKQSEEEAQDATRSEDDEGATISNGRGVPSELETEGTDDGTELACSGRDAMASRAESGREEFSRKDEGSGIGSEVREEESASIEDDESDSARIGGLPVRVRYGDGEEKSSHEEESL